MRRRATRRVPETHPLVRRRAAFASLAIGALLLTACTENSSTDTDFDAWYDQMRTVLGDTNGVGGGGGATPGSVDLSTMRTGKWVVYAACNNTNVLHIRIRGGSTILAETDLPCGATIAIPVTIDSSTARQFEIQTSHPKGSTGTGWWSAQVNSASWKQTESFSFN